MLSSEAEGLAVAAVRRDSASEPIPDLWDWLLRAAIVCSVGVVIYLAVTQKVYSPLLRATQLHGWGEIVLRPSLLWVTMGALLLGFRTFLWLRYRPSPSAGLIDAPALTVIIPAYNEGAMVAQAIHSVASADYPRDRLEIFVVDDGSRDDTWEHIAAAAARHPDLVTAVRFGRNRGKRAALEEGFRRARGDVVVTIDSDSVIERGTLLAMAAPFRDPGVGAVAGKVVVLNRRRGLIPRMLQVRYVLAFDMLRAAQSTYGTVYCCPGALAGYRTSAVRKVLDRWVNQTFLGAPCTYGEDRALTNYILAEGYDTVYQRTAVVHTVVPETYGRLCKMFLRWDRSYIREEIRFAAIVWKRPLGSMSIALVDSIITNLRFPVVYVTLALVFLLMIEDPSVFPRVLLAIGLMSALYMLYYLRSERSFDVVYGILYSYFAFFALFWIFPYALLTVRARSWLTR